MMKKKPGMKLRIAAGVAALGALLPGAAATVAVGGGVATVATAASVATAEPAQAYSVTPRAYYQWDGYKTCYRMEYRTYAWWEDPFNNRDGLYPLYTVPARYCGR